MLALFKTLAGMVRHLDPERVFLSADFTQAKVVCGEAQTFGIPTLKKKPVYDKMELRFATPEVLTALEDGQSCEEADYDAQLWWDLGVVLYLLCTGNRMPFSNANFRVTLRLI